MIGVLDLFYQFRKVITFIEMSEQIDGFLQIGSSYNFDRNRLSGYRSKTIDSQGFHKWTQGNMYKSSYAHFHSKVNLEPLRILPTPKTQLFPATVDTSPLFTQKTSMRRASPPWPNKASSKISLEKIPSGYRRLDSTSIATLLSIEAK